MALTARSRLDTHLCVLGATLEEPVGVPDEHHRTYSGLRLIALPPEVTTLAHVKVGHTSSRTCYGSYLS